MTETLESDAVASSSEERGMPSALFPDDQEERSGLGSWEKSSSSKAGTPVEESSAIGCH